MSVVILWRLRKEVVYKGVQYQIRVLLSATPA